MKSTFNIATAALMRPMSEMLFGDGRERGRLMGAQQAQALANADYNQARAQGQQQRNYWGSAAGMDETARMAGGDFSNASLGDLAEGALKRAQDERLNLARTYAMTGDTNLDQYYAGRQKQQVHDAAAYGNDPVKAAEMAAIFNHGKLFENAGQGQAFNVTTGQMRDSPYTRALIGTEQAQSRNYDASANRYNALADDVRQGMTLVNPDGSPTPTGSFGLSGMGINDVWGGLIGQESGGRQSAVSPKGAVGVAQVMPATAPIAAKLAGLPYDERRYRTDPQYNAALGKAYLKEMHRMFGGDMELALAAYNAGPGRVQQALKRDRAAGGNGTFSSVSRFLPRETQNYVPSIARRIGGSGVPMKYAGPQMAKQMFPTGGDGFTQVDAKHPVFQRQVGLDIDGKPITEFNADQYNRFSGWAQANGYNNQQQAMQAWVAGGMPDADGGVLPQLAPDSLANLLVSALTPKLLSNPSAGQTPAPVRKAPPANQAPQRVIASKSAVQKPTPSKPANNQPLTKAELQEMKEIEDYARISKTNPKAAMQVARSKGRTISPRVVAEFKRKGFAI